MLQLMLYSALSGWFRRMLLSQLKWIRSQHLWPREACLDWRQLLSWSHWCCCWTRSQKAGWYSRDQVQCLWNSCWLCRCCHRWSRRDHWCLLRCCWRDSCEVLVPKIVARKIHLQSQLFLLLLHWECTEFELFWSLKDGIIKQSSSYIILILIDSPAGDWSWGGLSGVRTTVGMVSIHDPEDTAASLTSSRSESCRGRRRGPRALP